MFVHTLSLFVIRPNPRGSPNQVAVYVCVFNSVCRGLRKGRIWLCVFVSVFVWLKKCQGVRDMGDRIVQTHTWGRIKVIDRLWHALTQRSKLNPDQWHLFVGVCVCFYAPFQFPSFEKATLVFLNFTSFVARWDLHYNKTKSPEADLWHGGALV